MALLAPRVVVLALLLVLRTLLRLLGAVDEDRQLGVLAHEVRHVADPLAPPLGLLLGEADGRCERTLGHRKDGFEHGAHLRDRAADRGLVLDVEEQREKLLGGVDPVVDERHQEPLGQVGRELRPSAGGALALGTGGEHAALAERLALGMGVLELRQERLEAVERDAGGGEEERGTLTELGIESHRERLGRQNREGRLPCNRSILFKLNFRPPR